MTIIFKPDNIEGFPGFYWDSRDVGAWTGPLNDWNVSHRSIIERLENRRGVVQAGGNMGMYPVFLSKYFETVDTFEPDNHNYEILRRNVDHHNIRNMATYRFGLGAEAREAGFVHGPYDNLGMHKIDDSSPEKIELITVDAFLDWFIDPIDFVWLDVETYELPALKGATQTIKEYKPVIMLENRNYAIDVFLNSLGYTFAEQSREDSIFVHPDGNRLL